MLTKRIDETTFIETVDARRVTGLEAMNSPEFAAFCRRFGIALHLPTLSVTVHLDMHDMMKVTQTYMGFKAEITNGGSDA